MDRLCRHALVGVVCVAAWVGISGSAPAWAQVSVDFDQDVYVVTGPGDVIVALILLDADTTTTAPDPLPEGLFSFGVATSFDASKATISGMADIVAAAELDHFGFAPGAFRSTAPGFGGVKGNIDVTAEPLTPYGSSVLARITITNLASAPDNYLLSLDFFRTVGVNEQLFLNGDGTVLDPQIQFGSARVIVIPEPTAALWLLIPCIALWQSRHRCARS